jgi:phosphate transport system substrate-binding protein
MKTILLLTAGVILLIGGCSREKSETTTRGNLHAFFAESTAPAMAEEVSRFLSSYSKAGANISYEFVSSDDAIRHMLRDTIRFIVSTRPMTSAEKQQLPRVEGFDVNEILIAYDGMAIVVHQKNLVDQITTVELVKILSGEIRRWEQLSDAGSMKGAIEVVYQDSSDVSWFTENRLLPGKSLRKDVQKSSSSPATIKSVSDRPLSIGLVGVLWVDSLHATAKVLKVAETRQTPDTTFRVPRERMGKFCTPHPANVFRNYYPLKRAIYAYTFGPVASFAAGFGTFVATADGQRVFLEKGVVPGTQQIRLKSAE